MRFVPLGVLLLFALVASSFILKPFNQSTSPNSNSQIIPSLEKNLITQVSHGQVPDIPFKIASGFTVHNFASQLGSARDLEFSPGGTLLVSDPNNGVVYALPDKNGDGVADEKRIVLRSSNRPHGLSFYNNQLFVAEVNQVVRYNWDEPNLTATLDKVLFSLPNNNDHNSRTITFDKAGNMYVSVGSTCNVCHEASDFSATVLISNANGDGPKVFAKGLRNAPFIQFNPQTNELWGTEMGRDNLGDNIPPDEVNIIKEGQDYGWPNCYGEKQPDKNFNSNANCDNTIAPIFQFPAHSAPLGWTFINSNQFPADFRGDLLVSLHGSWNRSSPIGYKVVHLKVSGNSIVSSEDFLTGFLPAGALIGPVQALARPVDLIFDTKGNLYLSDDKSGHVFIIQKQ